MTRKKYNWNEEFEYGLSLGNGMGGIPVITTAKIVYFNDQPYMANNGMKKMSLPRLLGMWEGRTPKLSKKLHTKYVKHLIKEYRAGRLIKK